MSTKADLAVYIGRFQPFHLGHLHAILAGLDGAHNVLVLIGDTGGPRGLKNPWTFEERVEMIQSSLNDEQFNRVYFDQIFDNHSNTKWAEQVQEVVGSFCSRRGTIREIELIGHDKDASSFYLKMFPQWKFRDTGYGKFDNGVLKAWSATNLRAMIWDDHLHYAIGIIPEQTLAWIYDDIKYQPEVYDELRAEWTAIRNYRKSWAGSPFPPMFVTTDCVVVQSGHVLLIQRGERPGKGLWALPGGFLDQLESIEDGAIRELLEETSIHLQPEVLRRCIHTVFVHDRAGSVSEEDRGRIITHVHVIKLDDTKPLPKVKAGDDAAAARWVPIGDINYREIFSDHGKILQKAIDTL